MLDDVQRRRFLVDPSGKDALPAAFAVLDIKLQECSGQLVIFPWRGCFAGAQPNDRVPHAHRLPRPKDKIADNPVALVQQADHRHPFRHWRNARLVCDRLRQPHVHGLTGLFLRRLLRQFGAVAACRRQQQGQRDESGTHAQSGVQGW